MKLNLLLVLATYVGLAALLDGPMQVSLLYLAPFAFVAVAMLLYLADPRRYG